MSSNGEASPQATCKATTKLGRPCRKQAVDGGLCVFHSGALDMSAIGRIGGQARGRRREERAGDKLEGLAHLALEELLTNAGGSATARAAAARLVLDKVAASSPYSAELAKRAAAAEMQAQRETELPFARARLERLIETRATERAKQLYEEQKRLDLAAVKAELEPDDD